MADDLKRTLLELATGYPAPGEDAGLLDVLLSAVPFAHNLKHIRRLASGIGKVPLYHGTTADNAASIMQHGLKLPHSGIAARNTVGELYGISPKEWDRVIERGGLKASGYGDETRLLSTAPAPVAERWMEGFPQGEIFSNLNEKARIFRWARDNNMSYGNAYEHLGALGSKQGIHKIREVLDSLGVEDKMRPKRPGGVLLEAIVNASDVPDRVRREATATLRWMRKYPEEKALEGWQHNYQDIKIDPSKIKRIKVVKGQIEGPEG